MCPGFNQQRHWDSTNEDLKVVSNRAGAVPSFTWDKCRKCMEMCAPKLGSYPLTATIRHGASLPLEARE